MHRCSRPRVRRLGSRGAAAGHGGNPRARARPSAPGGCGDCARGASRVRVSNGKRQADPTGRSPSRTWRRGRSNCRGSGGFAARKHRRTDAGSRRRAELEIVLSCRMSEDGHGRRHRRQRGHRRLGGRHGDLGARDRLASVERPQLSRAGVPGPRQRAGAVFRSDQGAVGPRLLRRRARPRRQHHDRRDGRQRRRGRRAAAERDTGCGAGIPVRRPTVSRPSTDGPPARSSTSSRAPAAIGCMEPPGSSSAIRRGRRFPRRSTAATQIRRSIASSCRLRSADPLARSAPVRVRRAGRPQSGRRRAGRHARHRRRGRSRARSRRRRSTICWPPPGSTGAPAHRTI